MPGRVSLSQQEELLLVGREALPAPRKSRNEDFGQGHAAGQRQRESSGLPLPSEPAEEPDPPVGEGRLTLTPSEVQTL